MIRAYVIRGGIWGPDGPITSPGMDTLRNAIGALPGITATVHNWSDWWGIVTAIRALPPSTRVVVIGYSGGGWKAAVIANNVKPWPIELLIAIDPSPAARMRVTPIGPNVNRAICYFNQAPALWGWAGGGLLRGSQVVIKKISENHAQVQFDTALRQEIVATVRAV